VKRRKEVNNVITRDEEWVRQSDMENRKAPTKITKLGAIMRFAAPVWVAAGTGVLAFEEPAPAAPPVAPGDAAVVVVASVVVAVGVGAAYKAAEEYGTQFDEAGGWGLYGIAPWPWK